MPPYPQSIFTGLPAVFVGRLLSIGIVIGCATRSLCLYQSWLYALVVAHVLLTAAPSLRELKRCEERGGVDSLCAIVLLVLSVGFGLQQFPVLTWYFGLHFALAEAFFIPRLDGSAGIVLGTYPRWRRFGWYILFYLTLQRSHLNLSPLPSHSLLFFSSLWFLLQSASLLRNASRFSLALRIWLLGYDGLAFVVLLVAEFANVKIEANHIVLYHVVWSTVATLPRQVMGNHRKVSVTYCAGLATAVFSLVWTAGKALSAGGEAAGLLWNQFTLATYFHFSFSLLPLHPALRAWITGWRAGGRPAATRGGYNAAA